MAISSFTGEYAFLDNMSVLPSPLPVPEDVIAGDVVVQSVEQAYYAARFPRELGRLAMLGATDGHHAKVLAPQLARDGEPYLTDDLLARREILYFLVRAKFIAFPELAEQLMATRGHKIIEGNNWGDAVWGMSPAPKRRNGIQGGVGENYMGEILMEVRDELRGGLFEEIRHDEALRAHMVEQLIRQAFAAGQTAYEAEAG